MIYADTAEEVAPCFPSDRLCLSPFGLNGVEVGAVWREVFESVAGVFDHALCVAAFVKCCIVHDNNGPRRQFREQIVPQPKVKDFRIDVGHG